MWYDDGEGLYGGVYCGGFYSCDFLCNLCVCYEFLRFGRSSSFNLCYFYLFMFNLLIWMNEDSMG